MGISTKTGDDGQTDFRGERVKKHHPKVEGCGTVDELNCIIGIANCHVKKQAIKDILEQVQHDLFTVQADICGKEEKVTEDLIAFLDKAIDAIEGQLPKQTEFILPRGNLSSTHLHHARAVCRRAERMTTKMGDYDESVNKNIQKYLNRLSDLLHLFARAESDKDIPVKYHRKS